MTPFRMPVCLRVHPPTQDIEARLAEIDARLRVIDDPNAIPAMPVDTPVAAPVAPGRDQAVQDIEARMAEIEARMADIDDDGAPNQK